MTYYPNQEAMVKQTLSEVIMSVGMWGGIKGHKKKGLKERLEGSQEMVKPVLIIDLLGICLEKRKLDKYSKLMKE